MNANEEVDRLNGEVLNLEQNLQATTGNYNNIREQLEHSKSRYQSLARARNTAVGELNAAQAQVVRLQAEVQDLEQSLTDAYANDPHERLEELEEHVAQADERWEELNIRHRNLEMRAGNLQTQLNEKNDAYNALKEKYNRLKGLYRTLNATVDTRCLNLFFLVSHTHVLQGIISRRKLVCRAGRAPCNSSSHVSSVIYVCQSRQIHQRWTISLLSPCTIQRLGQRGCWRGECEPSDRYAGYYQKEESHCGYRVNGVGCSYRYYLVIYLPISLYSFMYICVASASSARSFGSTGFRFK